MTQECCLTFTIQYVLYCGRLVASYLMESDTLQYNQTRWPIASSIGLATNTQQRPVIYVLTNDSLCGRTRTVQVEGCYKYEYILRLIDRWWRSTCTCTTTRSDPWGLSLRSSFFGNKDKSIALWSNWAFCLDHITNTNTCTVSLTLIFALLVQVQERYFDKHPLIQYIQLID